jgi:tetratricopeptide (TPR) repeat protein
MKFGSRTRFAFILLVALALVRPRAYGQTVAADAGTATPSSGDGGAASASIVTSGASTTSPTTATDSDAGGATPSAQNAGIATIANEPPPAAVAPRPDPTPEQIEALRLLENEVAGFAERGDAYRRSINGLLQREHDSQLDRLRRGFDRQIAAEREAEAQARRHAIQVFEHFIEMYPDDPDHTPDVMFRLAELYYDESAYAKLEADEQLDRLRAQREAANQSTDDLVSQPVDYRCSILLYRHIVQRFDRFRLRDATHYLLGWVLKEMGQEDESITSYRGMVCPARYHYEAAFDLAAQLVQGQDTPVSCPHLFDVLRPFGADLITPAANVAANAQGGDGGAAAPSRDTSINASLTPTGDSTESEPMPIPRDYAECEPMNGANGRPTRYAGEVWYYIGDYHFDNPPLGNADLGNAYAIAAYQASMRAAETRRPVASSGAPSGTGNAPIGLQGTDTSTHADPSMSNTGNGVTALNSPGRSQFSADIEYGAYWSKSLYKIGWSYFRMINGYPRALEAFSRLLDYYDYAGAETATQGNRSDTIKWIGVIFTEASWGLAANNDAIECQALVESVARPPTDAPRPFDCAGIMRIMSPLSPVAVMNARDSQAAARTTPVPGRIAYIPQDRPWTPEAYLELANDYFQQTKYYEAITLYRIFLQLYPLHFQAPHVAENIAISYERQRQFDAAINARGRLADYTEHSRWWDANNSHPDAQRYAELVARNSLHDNAIQHHQHATQLRSQSATFARCAAGQNVGETCTGARNARDRAALQTRAFETLQRANEEYGLAITAYNQFIQNYPNDEAAYEFRYNRADAMYWAGRYADAARAYAEVRESNENDQFLVAAAFMAVKAYEAQIRLAANTHQLDPCLAVRAGINASELLDAQTGRPLLDGAQASQCANVPTAQAGAAPAATPSGAPSGAPGGANILAINIPDPVRQLMDARIAFTNRVPRALDSENGLREVFTPDPAHPESNPPFRAKFAYLNARTLLWYGQVRDAEALYRQILQTYCNDATVAGAAFADLHNLLLLQGRDDDREALANEQASRTCSGVNTDIIRQTLTDSRFRHAMDTFHQAERASGAESLQLYERAAIEMRAAVRAQPNHPQAPLATFYTALAFERTNRFDTATQTYIQITQQYNNLNVIGSNPPRELEGQDRQERINILEVSNFRAAVNSDRTFDYEGAIRYFNAVISDPRFGTAQDHASHVHDALASIALIQTNLGRWTQARDAWRAFLPRTEAGREHAVAQYRIAEMPFRAQNWGEAVRAFQEYRRTVPMSADTAEFHVQAQYNIAQALRNQNDQAGYRRELRAVARVFEQSGQRPASRAAVFAAEALFLDLDARVNAFTQRTLTQGTGDRLAAQVRALDTELSGIDDDSVRIFLLLGGEYSIAALERNGEAHEHLATQEARVTSLFQLSAAQNRQITTAEASATRLEHLADQLNGRNPTLEDRLRSQAQEVRDRIQTMRDNMTSELQTQFDRLAAEQRRSAIRSYALAIHLARRTNIPTTYASRALEHIRLEENAPLIEEAIRAMPANLVQATQFQYTPHMFDSEAPGATLTQQQPVATPGLAGE